MAEFVTETRRHIGSLYGVEHVTKFEYSGPIYANRNIVRMTPRGEAHEWKIETTPFAPSSSYMDAFGNRVTLFYLAGQHESFTIRASGVAPALAPYGEAIEEYREESWLVDFCPLSLEISRAGSIENILAAVRNRMEYQKGTTSVSTKASEALAHGYGVCQDFAHAALAALRQAGYLARYSAGYCFGEGSMHAWIEVLDDNGVWTIYDPTNEGEAGTLISVAVGRDYRDTAPVLGSYLGAATSMMDASVKMIDHEFSI